MSISDQLAEQYRAKSTEVKPPAGQRQVYRELFERQHAKTSKRVRRKPLLTIALAILAVSVIAGFTRYAWVHFGDDRVRVEYKKTSGEVLSSALSSQIHQRLARVQAELSSGESAVVYLPEILRIYPEVKGMELLLVSNPAATTDYQAWEKTLLDRDENVKRLPNGSMGFDFVRGIEESYFGGVISPESLEQLPEMRSESAEQGGKAVWRMQGGDVDDPFPTLTTIYRDQAQNEVFVSAQWFNQKVLSRGVTGAVELDKIEVDGITVQYTLTEPELLSDTNRLQTLQWVETFEDHSILYTVGTPSLSLTKEDLISVMKGLKAQ